MPINAHAVNFFDIVGEKGGDILVSRPVDRHAEFVAVFGAEPLFEIGARKPIVAEPIQVGELLVGQLVELAVGAGGETFAHEVVDIESGVGDIAAFACHPIRKRHRQLQARMSADEIGIVDIGVVEIAVRLHLGLHRLHDLAFAEELMIDLDAGDILENLGQDFRFVFVGGNRFGKDIDFHPFERRGGFGEPLQLGALVGAREGGRRKRALRIDRVLALFVEPAVDDGVGGECGLPESATTAASSLIPIFICMFSFPWRANPAKKSITRIASWAD